MNKYEAMAILKPTFSEAEVQKLADKFKAVIEEKGGSVSQAGLWEKRKLAYEVGGFREGNYVLFLFEAPAAVPQELNRQMRINDDVIRHRVFRIDE